MTAGQTISSQETFDLVAALAFLARRAIRGMELVTDGSYHRTVRQGSAAGVIGVHAGAGGGLRLVVRGDLSSTDIAPLVRRMFDLDADLAAIHAHLRSDEALAPLVAASPSTRVFHGVDPFEVAIRSIIGQQVTVTRARELNSLLVERCGDPLPDGAAPLDRLFPTPRGLLDADLGRFGMPGARVAALKAMAEAAVEDPGLFARLDSIDETTARLRAVKGIGDWTAHYIAMRGCGEPDAFPASDAGLLRGAAVLFGRRPSPRELLARAEAWRPWRAYAAHLLWAVDGGPIRPQAAECR